MRLSTLIFTCFLALQLSAQRLDHSVVGSAGALLSASGTVSLHLTVGELAVDRHSDRMTLTQGFHQSLSPLLRASAWQAEEIDLQVAAFPNPTADRLTVTGDWLTGDRVEVNSLLGRRLIDRPLGDGPAELSLAAYPSGTYLLTIRREGRALHTIRIIRR